jgi:hypothetical protein
VNELVNGIRLARLPHPYTIWLFLLMSNFLRALLSVIVLAGFLLLNRGGEVAGWYEPVEFLEGGCSGPFIPVSLPLNDLGSAEYVRLNGGLTGFTGGLYPGGANVPPVDHYLAGLEIASQVVPLNSAGHPDPVNGKIVLVSVGMSNAANEFDGFMTQANGDPTINPRLVIVNGAQPGQTADDWSDPNGTPWGQLDQYLAEAGVTPAQVQVAWVKEALGGPGDFPEMAQTLQGHLEAIARNLHLRYANLKMAYYSSRTRAYAYWQGLSPEPTAFESGFAVKWMIAKQIAGNPTLNYDPDAGPVVAPYLLWGPYLWIDGLNPRSDGRIWTPADLNGDCVHPSPHGVHQVADQLMAFFKMNGTASPWFMTDPSLLFRQYLPFLRW